MKSQDDNTANQTTIIEFILVYVEEVLKYIDVTSNISVLSIGENWSSQSVWEELDNLVVWFSFDEFQLKLLKGFLIVLFLTIIAIFFVWKTHGPRINSRFMKPETTKVIDELKKSVAQLKLPREHTPRI